MQVGPAEMQNHKQQAKSFGKASTSTGPGKAKAKPKAAKRNAMEKAHAAMENATPASSGFGYSDKEEAEMLQSFADVAAGGAAPIRPQLATKPTAGPSAVVKPRATDAKGKGKDSASAVPTSAARCPAPVTQVLDSWDDPEPLSVEFVESNADLAVQTKFLKALEQEEAVVDVGAGGKVRGYGKKLHVMSPLILAVDQVKEAWEPLGKSVAEVNSAGSRTVTMCRHRLADCSCCVVNESVYAFNHSAYYLKPSDLDAIPRGVRMYILVDIASSSKTTMTYEDGQCRTQTSQGATFTHQDHRWLLEEQHFDNTSYYPVVVASTPRKVFIKAVVQDYIYGDMMVQAFGRATAGANYTQSTAPSVYDPEAPSAYVPWDEDLPESVVTEEAIAIPDEGSKPHSADVTPPIAKIDVTLSTECGCMTLLKSRFRSLVGWLGAKGFGGDIHRPKKELAQVEEPTKDELDLWGVTNVVWEDTMLYAERIMNKDTLVSKAEVIKATTIGTNAILRRAKMPLACAERAVHLALGKVRKTQLTFARVAVVDHTSRYDQMLEDYKAHTTYVCWGAVGSGIALVLGTGIHLAMSGGYLLFLTTSILSGVGGVAVVVCSLVLAVRRTKQAIADFHRDEFHRELTRR